MAAAILIESQWNLNMKFSQVTQVSVDINRITVEFKLVLLLSAILQIEY